MANVFISYARRDRERVAQLTTALEGEGLSVWWDPDLLPGRRYRQIIADELAIADSVIVVWTAASLDSDWVQDEAEEGRQRGVLIPVVLEPVRPPAGFRQVQAADLSQWAGSPQHPEFRSLVFAIRSLVQIARASGRAAAVAAPGREVAEGERVEPDAEAVVESTPPVVEKAAPPTTEPAPAAAAVAPRLPPQQPPPVIPDPTPLPTSARGILFRILFQWPLWVGAAVVMAGLVALIDAATQSDSAVAYLWSLVPLPTALVALAARRTGVGDRSAKVLGWVSVGVFFAVLALMLIAALASGEAPRFIIPLALLLGLAAASVAFVLGAGVALAVRLTHAPATTTAARPPAAPATPDGGPALRFLFSRLAWGLVAAVMAGLVLLGVTQDQFSRLGTFLICLAPLAAGWTASACRRSGMGVGARRIVAMACGAGWVAALLILFGFPLRLIAYHLGMVSMLFMPTPLGVASFGLLGASVTFAVAAATALISSRRT